MRIKNLLRSRILCDVIVSKTKTGLHSLIFSVVWIPILVCPLKERCSCSHLPFESSENVLPAGPQDRRRPSGHQTGPCWSDQPAQMLWTCFQTGSLFCHCFASSSSSSLSWLPPGDQVVFLSLKIFKNLVLEALNHSIQNGDPQGSTLGSTLDHQRTSWQTFGACSHNFGSRL
jgi:hypothetical protein